MVWQPNILNNCYELSGGYALPNHPPEALPLDPAGGLPIPRPPPPNPGYAIPGKYMPLIYFADVIQSKQDAGLIRCEHHHE